MQSEWCVSEYDANTVHPSLAVPFSVTHRQVRINCKKKKHHNDTGCHSVSDEFYHCYYLVIGAMKYCISPSAHAIITFFSLLRSVTLKITHKSSGFVCVSDVFMNFYYWYYYCTPSAILTTPKCCVWNAAVCVSE